MFKIFRESSVLKQTGLLIASVFLVAASFWAPYFQVLHNHRTFLSVDALVILGVSLLTGLLAVRIVSDKFIIRLQEQMTVFLFRFRLVLLILLLPSAFILLSFLNREVLHSFMNSADEHACYFLAECIRLGRLWVPTHPLQEFFDVVHVGSRGGKWFSVYPPGWPLIWAAGLSFGFQDFLNPLMSVLSLGFLYKIGKRIHGNTAALFSIFILLMSPFFLFTSASYYSHTTCLLMMTLFAYAYLRWHDAEKESTRIVWAGIAAAAIGYGLMTRYLTMAAFAAPFLWHGFSPVLLRKRKMRQSDWLVIAILMVFFCLVLYQNYNVTGKPFRAPNKHDKSWERLGFRGFYTPLDGLVFVLARIFYLVDWAPPFLIVLYFAAVFHRKKQTSLESLFKFAFLWPSLIYFFYFSWGGNQYGPRYWYEGFPFLVLVAMGFLHQAFSASTGNFSRQKFFSAALLISLIGGIYQFVKHADYFETVSRERKALYMLSEKKIQKPAIVLIQGVLGDKLIMAQDDAVRNPPKLDARILYAHDRGEKNNELNKYFPNRVFYRGSFDRQRKEAVLEPLDFRA